MENRAQALALLPEREADYDTSCNTLNQALTAGVPKSVMAAQQSVSFALAHLNATRADVGLSAVTGPKMRSVDELLDMQQVSTALAA